MPRNRPRRRGLLSQWAGDSPSRRFVAWLAQSAILLAVAGAIFAVIWFVLMPMMIDGLVDVFQRRMDR